MCCFALKTGKMSGLKASLLHFPLGYTCLVSPLACLLAGEAHLRCSIADTSYPQKNLCSRVSVPLRSDSKKTIEGIQACWSKQNLGWCPEYCAAVFPVLVFQLSKQQNRTRTTSSTVLGTPPNRTRTKKFSLEKSFEVVALLVGFSAGTHRKLGFSPLRTVHETVLGHLLKNWAYPSRSCKFAAISVRNIHE